MASTREGLAAAALYEREILMLADRRTREAWRMSLELTAPLVATHAQQVARRLAAEVSTGRYAFQPLQPHAALLGGKPRTIYRVDPLDAVVFAALTRLLAAAIEPRLGAHLYSYRKGHSQWTACRALLRYLRAHVSARPDPRTRGVFVLRRDVRRYDEHIPVGDDSTLWPTLAALIGENSFGFRGDFAAFLRRAFRPPVAREDGARPLAAGVPTGLPTQTIACNTYLLPLDRELCAIPGGFYARFGDDILFAHPGLDAAEEAARRLAAGIEQLGLQFNPDKSHALWLTRPGRSHAAAAAFTPAARLSYLGFDVGFDGARLRADKRRSLWLSLRARIANADRMLADLPSAERADALCHVVRTALDRRSPLCDRYAAWLELDVMSLEDLKQLDHQIALTVAEQLAGRRGVRAFREFSARTLYTRHGLPCLVRSFAEARNAGRRTR